MGEENKNPACPNCSTSKKMSVRQHDVDRDGRIVADIYACDACQAWSKIPRVEDRAAEIARLEKRLADLR